MRCPSKFAPAFTMKRSKTFRSRTCLIFIALAVFAARAYSRPPTQDLKGEVVGAKDLPIAGAICTLRGPGLPEAGIAVVTGEKGGFNYPGLPPGQYDLACTAVDHLPVLQKALEITADTAPTLRIALPDAEKLKQTIEVHETATAIPPESAPSGRISSPQLLSLPLVEQEFKASLPLVPGVVRTPDGKINVKGAVENQGMLLVDSMEMVDPVTGSYSIDMPLDAVESVSVFKTPYRADFGHFSGGLTSVTTKPPSNQWHLELNDLIPTPRIETGQIVGLADNSHRLRFTGPLLRDRLSMGESFAYVMNQIPVRGLPWPHNQTKKQGFNSFTDFQYIFSPQHLTTVNVHLFPLRRQYANINSLTPQTASSDYGQRGVSIGVTDRYLFASGGVLTSLAQYMDFSSYGHGQGIAAMQVTPEGWGGNFFNAFTRTSNQGEAQETFQYPHKTWHGQHELKIGGDGVFRTFRGTSQSSPVNILRADGSLAETIDFTGAGLLGATDSEVGVFAQDHWSLNDHLAVDLGLRFSGQSLGKKAALAPRVGIVFAPGANGKTILRGGIGVFYDRSPLLANSFTDNPNRVLTLFDAEENPLGPPVMLQNAYARYNGQQFQILPPGSDLGSTPFNLTWNVEANRELLPHVVMRLDYLASQTYDQFIVGPEQVPGTSPQLLLTNHGGSNYGEFEATVRVRPRESADINISYVHSQARGDLNTLSTVFVPFEEPVIRTNFYADLPSNVPDRLVAWGVFKIPWKITASPVLDLHTGFPYSAVDDLQNYVGQPDSLRFPTLLSLDMKLSKDFRLSFIPWLKTHKFRGALGLYNITNHLNPRDVYNNVTSPNYGHFAGPQHFSIATFLDLVY